MHVPSPLDPKMTLGPAFEYRPGAARAGRNGQALDAVRAK